MAKNQPMSQNAPDPWARVRLRNGKLSGMLTDDLAKNIMPRSGDNMSSKRSNTGIPVNIKVYYGPKRKS